MTQLPASTRSLRAAALTGSFLQALETQLPHEVTHAVLASHFGKPLPRWADEGIAVLHETTEYQLNHDVRCRELLNAGRGIRLKVLFPLKEYPRDTIALYAQGHSVARFLLTREVKADGGMSSRFENDVLKTGRAVAPKK